MIEIDHKTDPGDQRSLPQSNTKHKSIYLRETNEESQVRLQS